VAAGGSCQFEGKTFGSCQAGRCACGGGPDQPCCPVPLEADESLACSTPTTICSDDPSKPGGSCVSCGVVGTFCCLGKRCMQPGTACQARPEEGFRCRKCGGPGEPCCINYMGAPLCDGALKCVAGASGERCG
jgi:hypothetical protein